MRRAPLVLLFLSAIAFADGQPHTPTPPYCPDIGACEKACDGGDVKACAAGGDLADAQAEAAVDNAARALALWQKACDKGDAPSCWHAGREAKGDDQAKKDFSRACKKKLAVACMALGDRLARSGKKQEIAASAKAYRQAAKLFEPACKRKDASACDALAGLYANGQGVAADAKKAEDFRQRACQITIGGPCRVPVRDHAVHADTPANPDEGGQ